MAYEIPYDSDYGHWYGIPQNVTNLVATLKQIANGDSVIGRIDAMWDMPDNGGSFKILLSTDGENFYFEKSVQTNYITLDVEPRTDYYIRIVTVLDISESEGTTSGVLQAQEGYIPSDTTTPATPTNLSLDVDTLIASWDAVGSTNIKYYELRTDTNYGDSENMVAQISATTVQTRLTERSGTLYLYAVNILGNYSEPASLEYEKDVGIPSDITLTPYPSMLRISVGSVPDGCTIEVMVDTDYICNTSGTLVFVPLPAGQHYVNVAYRDAFGVAEYSPTYSAIVPSSGGGSDHPWADFDEQDRLIICYPTQGGDIILDNGVMTIPEDCMILQTELQRVGLPHKILYIDSSVYEPIEGTITLENDVMTIPESGAVLNMELQRTNLPQKILDIE